MRKFEIGDRVKVVNHNEYNGMRGVVEGYFTTTDYIFIDLGLDFNGTYGGDGVVDSTNKKIEIDHDNGGWFSPNELELDKESKVLEILRSHENRRRIRI